MSELINFKSELKRTHLAPEFNYYIFEDTIKNIDFIKLASIILEQEQNIIKNTKGKIGDKVLDGYTGLGADSLTSRFSYFNLLTWESDIIKTLRHEIVNAHNNFLQKINVPMPEKLFIQCWANVMRKGEQIKPHIHGVTPDSYIGGHIIVQANKTNTYYINPITQTNEPVSYKSENKVGKITLFQNFLPHFTSKVENDDIRITIAFDMEVSENPNSNNFIRLI